MSPIVARQGYLIQSYKYTDIQTYKYTDIHMCKYTDTQVYKYKDMQMYKYTDIQIYKYTDIHIYANTQTHRYSNTKTGSLKKNSFNSPAFAELKNNDIFRCVSISISAKRRQARAELCQAQTSLS